MIEAAECEDLLGSPRLRLRRRRNVGPPVLYIHGATFPCALAIGYRFADGRSWEDSLAEEGFEVWGLDFAGYGGSERPDAAKFLARAEEAVTQIARAVDFIRNESGGARVNIIAHSWGTIPAAMFAAAAPEALQSLTLFGPILQRDGAAPTDSTPADAWRLITVADQRKRFEVDTPPGVPSVLAEPDLKRWGEAWLATDRAAAGRSPRAVAVPAGPMLDITRMWSGSHFYDPAAIEKPTLVVHGAWDSLCTDEDVARFLAASRDHPRFDVKLPKGGHLMHLEAGRERLWRAVNIFLLKHAEPER